MYAGTTETAFLLCFLPLGRKCQRWCAASLHEERTSFGHKDPAKEPMEGQTTYRASYKGTSTEEELLAAKPPGCFCASAPQQGRAEEIRCLIGKELFANVVLSTSDPTVELKDVKKSGNGVVLLVFGPLGHPAIKYMCDDYNLPREQRRVRWIHSLSAGVDVFRLGELRQEVKEIPFTNGRGCYSSILAEHVIYSMLYFNRQTWRLQESRAKHKWDPFDMVELRGKTMGIIGYGDIGRATGRLAVAFGMEVTGVKRSPPAEDVDEYGVRLVHGEAERERIIRESDIVVNILPATDETKQFFSRERFAAMKPTAVYINIGRGTTQNDQDLACALRDGVIRGAAVDVFEEEPLPTGSPIWEVTDDRILFTPHNGCMSANSFSTVVDTFLKNAISFMQGKAFDGYQPNLDAGY